MEIVVAKSDLDAALGVVKDAMASGGTGIASHYLFRAQETDGVMGVEVLTTSGRLFASCPLVAAKADVEGAFTLEGKRLRTCLSRVKDTALSFVLDDKSVTVKTPQGKQKFETLDPDSFPYWDETQAEAESVATIPAARLHAALNYSKQFVSDEETTSPQICVSEIQNGTMFSTDKTAAALITIPGLEKSNMRIHGKDASAILGFLAGIKEGDVEVLEHERALFLRRVTDGAIFGNAPFQSKFPSMTMPGNEDHHYWLLSKETLLSAIPFLVSGAAWEDSRVRLWRPKPDGPLKMGMKTTTGSETVTDIAIIESGSATAKADEAPIPDLPKGGFLLAHASLAKILNAWEGDTVRFGINKRAKGGYLRLHTESGGVKFLTIMAWLR